MSQFRTGDFDRSKVSKFHSRFAPAHAAESLHQVDLSRLWENGKRLILVDVDHTLVKWGIHEASDQVVEWIELAKGMGFDICIISNTHNLERLGKISAALGIATVRGKFKPSRAMFRLAMIKFQRRPDETIMIGDQLLTDVFGANRSGIDAIWVRKMEGHEFKGTAINRMVERFLTGGLYEALIAPLDEKEDTRSEKDKPLRDRVIVHQFVKFAVVGGSSFLIDGAIRWILLFMVHSGKELLSIRGGTWLQQNAPFFFGGYETPQKAFYPVAATIAACFAIINSFFLNRLWTFKIRGKAERLAQLRRFVIISVIGMVINVTVSSALNNVIPGHPKWSGFVALVIASAIVAVWNFVGQRKYAFRVKSA